VTAASLSCVITFNKQLKGHRIKMNPSCSRCVSSMWHSIHRKTDLDTRQCSLHFGCHTDHILYKLKIPRKYSKDDKV